VREMTAEVPSSHGHERSNAWWLPSMQLDQRVLGGAVARLAGRARPALWEGSAGRAVATPWVGLLEVAAGGSS
jgi:hypothetical protein